VQRLSAELRAIKNSRVWRAYQSIRPLVARAGGMRSFFHNWRSRQG
jgi:hypothetical protein